MSEPEFEFHHNFAYLPVPEPLKPYFFDSSDYTLEKIEPLNRINIFVGKNNSGKSWLLRELLKANYGEYFYKDEKITALKMKVNDLKDFIESQIKQLKNTLTASNDAFESAYRSVQSNILDGSLNIQSFSKFYSDLIELNQQLGHETGNGNGQLSYFEQFRAVVSPESYQNFYKNNVDKVSELKRNIESEFSIPDSKSKLIKIFVPTHRTLSRNFFNKDVNLTYMKLSYEIDFDDLNNKKIQSSGSEMILNYQDMVTGYEIFDNIKALLLTDSISRDRLRDFEFFISDYFFQGQRFSITPSELNAENQTDKSIGHIKIKISNDNDYKIHNLGTGLQMMIILTWPLFYYESGMIFIEEPELYLHPGFQNQLMEIYANNERAKNFQFFIATHSNHIIDSVNNFDKINIFTLDKQKTDHFCLGYINFGNLMPYELLGVRSSSLALANCIIWVEGPSDRIYIKKWFELCCELKKHELDLKINLIEGLHYQILTYGGSVVSHFSFDQSDLKEELITTFKINSKAIFVADSDKTDETGGLKSSVSRIFEEIGKTDGYAWITEGRTIENYLTSDVINTAFGKNDEIPQIGKFDKIEDYLKTNKQLFGKSYTKVEFAKKITENMKTDDFKDNLDLLGLSDKLKSIIEKIKEWNGL